nr:MAG TPA: hypothetical protein [Caudoviricetes sp.]
MGLLRSFLRLGLLMIWTETLTCRIYMIKLL